MFIYITYVSRCASTLCALTLSYILILDQYVVRYSNVKIKTDINQSKYFCKTCVLVKIFQQQFCFLFTLDRKRGSHMYISWNNQGSRFKNKQTWTSYQISMEWIKIFGEQTLFVEIWNKYKLNSFKAWKKCFNGFCNWYYSLSKTLWKKYSIDELIRSRSRAVNMSEHFYS